MSRGKAWSGEEIKILAKYYPIESMDVLAIRLPNRKPEAIKKMAYKLGIKKKKTDIASKHSYEINYEIVEGEKPQKTKLPLETNTYKTKYEFNTDEKIRQIGNEIIEMLIKKNHDYGDNNLIRRGMLGIIVRLEDKLSRLDNLTKTKTTKVDESIEDTLKDIAGYAINAIRLMKEGKI